MSGLYIHIPFCKQACHYCDFHFSTSMLYRDKFIEALLKEIELSSGYLIEKEVNTIYFGGGTPSLLTEKELNLVFNQLAKFYNWKSNIEITLEANPDDLNTEKLKSIKNAGINRLSIGIQSFYEEDLVWMNRAHRAEEAQICIKNAQDFGFENLSCDLIFGIPNGSVEKTVLNCTQLMDYGIPHISAYSLTVEEKTPLKKMIRKGLKESPEDGDQLKQFNLVADLLESGGYGHYEISNYALPGMESKHNSSYWAGEPYLGLGPSSHSFNGKARRWNVRNNAIYIKKIMDESSLPFEEEILSRENKINEFILTRLRTKPGINFNEILSVTGYRLKEERAQEIDFHLHKGNLEMNDRALILTRKGKGLADSISSDLFVNTD